MFCDQCGSQLQPAQQSCTRCGKPVLGPVAYRRNRVQEHVRLVGILWMAYSALTVVGGVAVIIVAQTIFGGALRMAPGPPSASTHSGYCFPANPTTNTRH